MGLCFGKKAKQQAPPTPVVAAQQPRPTPAPAPLQPAPVPLQPAPNASEPEPRVLVQEVSKPAPSLKELEGVWTQRDDGIVAEMLQMKRRVSLFGIPLTELLTLEPDEVDILLSEERSPHDIADGLIFLSETEQAQVLQAMTPELAAAIRALWGNKENQQPVTQAPLGATLLTTSTVSKSQPSMLRPPNSMLRAPKVTR